MLRTGEKTENGERAIGACDAETVDEESALAKAGIFPDNRKKNRKVTSLPTRSASPLSRGDHTGGSKSGRL